MSPIPMTRRRAAIALSCLPLAGAAHAARDGVEIRYLIERDRREPSGDIAQRTFEGAMVLASGESKEADVRDEYRIGLTMTERGGVAHVRLSVWDNRLPDNDLVGTADADVPIGGEAKLTLLTSDNVHYPIVLAATRRKLADR